MAFRVDSEVGALKQAIMQPWGVRLYNGPL
jgi:hypothetical protein